MIYLLHF